MFCVRNLERLITMMHCCISGNLYDFHANNVCEVTIAKLGHIFGIEPMAH